MLIYKAFNKTLETYEISGKAIAQAANASESLVSQFRRGKKGVTDEMLDKLLGAMQTLAPGSRRYFCSLVAGESGREGSLLNVIESLSEEEIPQLLIEIAKRWQTPQKQVLQAR